MPFEFAAPMPGPLIRELTLHDLERILDIDETITKAKRGAADNDLWRLLAETTTCFGAEIDGTLAGFVLADVRPWEFGNRAHVGWIIAIGVDPKHQKSGIGRALGDRVLHEFHRLGVQEVKTLVGAKDRGLFGYFHELGFRPAKETVLQRATAHAATGRAETRKPKTSRRSRSHGRRPAAGTRRAGRR